MQFFQWVAWIYLWINWQFHISTKVSNEASLQWIFRWPSKHQNGNLYISICPQDQLQISSASYIARHVDWPPKKVILSRTRFRQQSSSIRFHETNFDFGLNKDLEAQLHLRLRSESTNSQLLRVSIFNTIQRGDARLHQCQGLLLLSSRLRVLRVVDADHGLRQGGEVPTQPPESCQISFMLHRGSHICNGHHTWASQSGKDLEDLSEAISNRSIILFQTWSFTWLTDCQRCN